jgi:hypothetical protein
MKKIPIGILTYKIESTFLVIFHITSGIQPSLYENITSGIQPSL